MTDQDRTARMAALDQGIARTNEDLNQMIESARSALATGIDRSLVANSLAAAFRDAIGEYGTQPIVRTLTIAVIRLAEDGGAP